LKFAFTDEQRMLKDTSQSFLAAESNSSTVRTASTSEKTYDPQLWRKICEDMYWQGILAPEACEGLGLGWVEMAIVLEAAGEALLTAPLFSSTQSTAALLLCPQSAMRDALLSSIVTGDVISLAMSDQREGWSSCGVVATDKSNTTLLSGSARFVPFGAAASKLLVVAVDALGAHSLWVVDPSQEGVVVTHTPTMDQTRAMASVSLENVAVSVDQLLADDAQALIEPILALSRILVVADQVGVAQASLDMSVDYTKERSQFDRTIASFQAIKHKAADMMLKVESARSLLYYAACVADAWFAGEASIEALQEAAFMASSCASEAAFFNAGTGIQMHGGVGITEEYDIQLYFKRARATESFLGRPAEMREAIARQLLDGGAACN
jgi:alkylation response protein AidB-like acyl-CoA dehydrogenase